MLEDMDSRKISSHAASISAYLRAGSLGFDVPLLAMW
jgi:hypothetical protein